MLAESLASGTQYRQWRCCTVQHSSFPQRVLCASQLPQLIRVFLQWLCCDCRFRQQLLPASLSLSVLDTEIFRRFSLSHLHSLLIQSEHHQLQSLLRSRGCIHPAQIAIAAFPASRVKLGTRAKNRERTLLGIPRTSASRRILLPFVGVSCAVSARCLCLCCPRTMVEIGSQQARPVVSIEKTGHLVDESSSQRKRHC